MNMPSRRRHLGSTGPRLLGATAVAFVTLACSSSATDVAANPDEVETQLPPDAPAQDISSLLDQFASNLELSTDGDWVVIRSDGVPDHDSPYFANGDPRHTPYDGDNPNFQLNPNRISAGQITYRIPRIPQEASTKEATPLGPIGVAVNGVAIYNQYAGPNRPLTFEIDSFDQFNGHPQQTGQYHYHIEPLSITGSSGKDTVIGLLLDGYPVYGPFEGGRLVTNADLDAYHGHYGATADFPDGIYHYHVTSEDPYINGNGFFGVAGTRSN